MNKKELQKFIEQRIFKADNGCWVWTLKLNEDGYGRTQLKGTMFKAHRLSYEAFIGEIPDGLIVRHMCDCRHCVNPDHLEIGTHQENMEDMTSRGRQYTPPQYGNQNRAKKVIANHIEFASLKKAAESIGVTTKTIRHRIHKKTLGYFYATL